MSGIKQIYRKKGANKLRQSPGKMCVQHFQQKRKEETPENPKSTNKAFLLFSRSTITNHFLKVFLNPPLMSSQFTSFMAASPRSFFFLCVPLLLGEDASTQQQKKTKRLLTFRSVPQPVERKKKEPFFSRRSPPSTACVRMCVLGNPCPSWPVRHLERSHTWAPSCESCYYACQSGWWIGVLCGKNVDWKKFIQDVVIIDWQNFYDSTFMEVS